MFILRPYQQDAIAAVQPLFTRRAPQRGIISLATGLGKTVIFSEIARKHPDRVLVLAHRDELITQAIDKLREHIPPDRSIGRVMAEMNECDAEIVVASVQSLRAQRLKRTWEPGTFSLIIVDEAHHAAAPSYQTILDYLAPNVILGVTATPYRSDRVTLESTFHRLLYHFGIREGIRDHWLVDLRPYRILTDTDIDTVHTQGGDLVSGELADAIDTPRRNQQLVDATIEHAPHRRFLAFTASVAHAQHLAETYQAAEISTAWIHADTPIIERRKILRDFQHGTIQGIANCGIFTEGFDAPWVEAIILARPTKSLSLFTQMVGRGTRPSDGKTDCIILDAVDNTRRHHIISVTDLIGLDTPLESGDSVAEAMDQEERKIPQVFALLKALRLPVQVETVPDLIADWVETRTLPPNTWQTVYDALEDLRGQDDVPPWVDLSWPINLPSETPTEKQRMTLIHYGWDPSLIPATRKEASWAIDYHLHLFKQWAEARIAIWAPLTHETPQAIHERMFSKPWHFKLATEKQLQWLQRRRIPDSPYPLTAGEASWIIDHITTTPRPIGPPRPIPHPPC